MYKLPQFQILILVRIVVVIIRERSVIYSDNLSLDRLYKLFAGLPNHFLLQVQSEEVYAHGHARDTINQ